MATKAEGVQSITIAPPKIGEVELLIEGTSPLVIARFSKKMEMMDKMAEGKTARKSARTARDYAQEMEDAKHIATPGGWEGIHAAGLRKACIDACRLADYKMTMAKLALHVMADGLNQDGEPIIRIYGAAEMCTARTRNSGASASTDIRSRPMYREWSCRVRYQYDADIFTAADVANLLSRVGLQCGIGEGRASSKMSAGCGWGFFRIVPTDEQPAVRAKYGIEER